MAGRTGNDPGGHSSQAEDGRRREQFASTVDWRCDLVGIGPDTPVRWVLNRDTKAVVWLNFREVEDGPWVLATKAEEGDFERKLLEGYPDILERDERPGVTTGEKFPAWVHEMHILRDDDRWEFVR